MGRRILSRRLRKDAIWEFHVTTEHGNIDGLLRRVHLDGDMLLSSDVMYSDNDGTCWQARQFESTAWAEPAATREEAIQNLLKQVERASTSVRRRQDSQQPRACSISS